MLDANSSEVTVPRQHVVDGRILLNISPQAVRNLTFDNDNLGFDGRFSGTAFYVQAPIQAVLGIYAKETGEGMRFAGRKLAEQQSTEQEESTAKQPDAKTRPRPSRSGLKLVT